ncbi:cytochrome P450 71A1-like [Senna tora]|uniref:Cytochrome P450 71A1-like n=1 Tax=Senna tora TaxID=362788 RepID=A0A834T1T6_9FABA|nr:cytochrome P450 71A1-like [Senna tora]
MVDELLLLNGVLNIGDFIPWLNFVDVQGYIKRMKALSKKLDKLMEHEERRKKNENYVANDMVDMLLHLSQDPTLEVKIQRDGVKAFILESIAAGTDTASVTLEWAMCELLKKPEIFKKAREELDRIAEDPTLEVKLERDGVKAFTLSHFLVQAKEFQQDMGNLEQMLNIHGQ